MSHYATLTRSSKSYKLDDINDGALVQLSHGWSKNGCVCDTQSPSFPCPTVWNFWYSASDYCLTNLLYFSHALSGNPEMHTTWWAHAHRANDPLTHLRCCTGFNTLPQTKYCHWIIQYVSMFIGNYSSCHGANMNNSHATITNIDHPCWMHGVNVLKYMKAIRETITVFHRKLFVRP